MKETILYKTIDRHGKIDVGKRNANKEAEIIIYMYKKPTKRDKLKFAKWSEDHEIVCTPD